MTPNSIRSEISRFAASLLKMGLVIDTNATITREISNSTAVLWATFPKYSDALTRREFATFADYRYCVENRQYTMMLFDGSLISSRYYFSHGDINQYNLAYYPCPVKIYEDDVYVSEGIGDTVDTIIQDCMSDYDWTKYLVMPLSEDFDEIDLDIRLLMRSPIRFDYNPSHQRENHPASHIHIMKDDCRIPIFGPISFGHFVSFIFRYFYNNLWLDNTYLREYSKSHWGKTTIKPYDKNDLYFDWSEQTTVS